MDVRYVGQQYILTVPLADAAEPARSGFLDDMRERFSAVE